MRPSTHSTRPEFVRRPLGALRVLAVGVLASLVLVGCTRSDNVSYRVETDTGDETWRQSGLIVVETDGSMDPSGVDPQRLLRFRGFDERREPFQVHLAVQCDLAILEYADRIIVRSPAFDHPVPILGGKLALSAGPILARIDAPATSGGEPGPTSREGVKGLRGVKGSGTFHCLAAANLIVFEGRSSDSFVFQEGDQPIRLDAETTWSVVAGSRRLRLDAPAQERPRFVMAPPPPTVDQRLKYLQATEAARILGPRGEPIATVPNAALVHSDGNDGLFFSGSFPTGLAGIQREPFVILQPAGNRYLLLLRAH